MMFMVREMYRHPSLAKWKVIFVTDRTQLEEQLAETSQSIGFTVNVADSIESLKQLLSTDSSDLVMAMIHKFREADLTETFPQLNTSPHILVMTDEAHRSQYSLLGANLDRGIPNAARLAYTGTPIDKTEKVFGSYIDKYTMRQSIEDGVTLEIVYEGRTHNAEVTDSAGMDAAFQDVFSDYNINERLAILGYGTKEAYLESKTTIAAKARDMVAHYVNHVFPNDYKAQIVATSREAAVRYREQVDEALAETIAALEASNPSNVAFSRLKRLKADVVISGGHNDELHVKAFTDPARHKTVIKSFKLPFDREDEGVAGDIGIVIVNNMLLTGFDAPVEQVMYLDRVIVAHGLLQAIARVNRVVGTSKEKGYIVAYVGVGHHLKKALDTYDEREQNEILDVLSFPEEELKALRAAEAAVMAFFEKNGVSDLTDHDAIFDLFYDEDLRFEFLRLFREFTNCLDIVFPAKEALDFMKNYQTLTSVSVMAARHLRDERLSMKGIPPKLRQITDAFLVSRGIETKVEPISILDEDFEKNVANRTRTKTKAAEIEHAIRHHLDVELNDDPDLQASFAEALAKILGEFRDNWNKIYDELEKLRQRIINAGKEPTYGLHRKKQMPIFRMLRREIFGDTEPDESAIGTLVSLTQHLFEDMEREIKLTGFWESIPARQKLKADLQRTLLQPDFSGLPGVLQNRNRITSRLMEIAEKNNDAILYAA